MNIELKPKHNILWIKSTEREIAVEVNKRRKKTDISILVKAIVFLVVIILAALLMLAVMKIAEGPSNPSDESNIESITSQTSSDIDNSGDNNESENNTSGTTEFESVTIDNNQVYVVDLILTSINIIRK